MNTRKIVLVLVGVLVISYVNMVSIVIMAHTGYGPHMWRPPGDDEWTCGFHDYVIGCWYDYRSRSEFLWDYRID